MSAAGTGTLAILIKRSQPVSTVTGLEGDLRILEIAEKKILASKATIELTEAIAYELPFADAAFDRVLLSLVFRPFDG